MFARWLALLTALFLFAAPAAASSAPGAHAPSGQCLTVDQTAQLTAFQTRLAAAGSTADAAALAHRRLAQAERVLGDARGLAPRNAGLLEGQARIDALQAAVDGAESPEAIANLFGARHTALKCDMNTGEIVATVLGFILGIIPGIILMILLC